MALKDKLGMDKYKDDFSEMSMFSSQVRGFGKIIKESELKDKKAKSEASEQLAFCKWLKHTYPNVLFRSDIQNQGARTPAMQNIMQIVDPYRKGWPDIVFYSFRLMIELKTLKGKPTPEQLELHNKLRQLGWDVYVCHGAEEAKEVVRKYILTAQKQTFNSTKTDPFDKNYLPF